MPAEEQGEVQDDADHGRCNAGERRGEFQFAVSGFNQRRPGEMIGNPM